MTTISSSATPAPGEGCPNQSLPTSDAARHKLLDSVIAGMLQEAAHDPVAQAKITAAGCALRFVSDGMTVALGSGTTSALFIRLLGRAVQAGAIRGLTCVSTSEAHAALAQDSGIAITDFDRVKIIDLGIDGADELGRDTRFVIKGGGGCALRERRAADRCLRLIIIADSSKCASGGKLGEKWPVPIDVVPEQIEAMTATLKEAGAQDVVLRMKGGKPWVTDDGNLILDARFGVIGDPAALVAALESMRSIGLRSHGLFEMATDIILASSMKSDHWVWLNGKWQTVGEDILLDELAARRQEVRAKTAAGLWERGLIVAQAVDEVPLQDLPKAVRRLDAEAEAIPHLTIREPADRGTASPECAARIRALSQAADLPFAVLLEVTEPAAYLPLLAEYGASAITVPVDSPDAGLLLQARGQSRCRVGIAIDPAEDPQRFMSLLERADHVMLLGKSFDRNRLSPEEFGESAALVLRS